MPTLNTNEWVEMPLTRLNAVRTFVVTFIAIGYASTMSHLGPTQEFLRHLGYDPSWFGIQIIFCLSGYLALRSLSRHGSSLRYLMSRMFRNGPLLVAYTFAAVSVIYPIFCAPGESFAQSLPKLTSYFFKTVLCIDPGARLPGLLDEAKYMCLIQGAIWTFRWGAFAHICMALGWRIGILKSKHVLLFAALSATAGYVALSYWAVSTGRDQLAPIFLALRLGYAFLAGAALWGWQHRLPKSAYGKIAILSALMGSAAIHYLFLPWTPLIEVLGTAFWTYAAVLLIQTPMKLTRWMDNWPNFVLGLYIGNWPVCQLLIKIYPEMHGWQLIFMTLGVTTLLAILTHAAISGHINRWASTALRRQVTI